MRCGLVAEPYVAQHGFHCRLACVAQARLGPRRPSPLAGQLGPWGSTEALAQVQALPHAPPCPPRPPRPDRLECAAFVRPMAEPRPLTRGYAPPHAARLRPPQKRMPIPPVPRGPRPCAMARSWLIWPSQPLSGPGWPWSARRRGEGHLAELASDRGGRRWIARSPVSRTKQARRPASGVRPSTTQNKSGETCRPATRASRTRSRALPAGQ